MNEGVMFFRELKHLESGDRLETITEDERECTLAWKRFDRRFNFKEYAPDAEWDSLYMRPEPPEDPTKIANYGLDIHDRKFPYYTEEYKRTMEEWSKPETNHDKFLEFIKEEWNRRWNGFFFYNGSKLEYITGRYYFFLQYWLIPVIKNGRSIRSNPEFRDNLLLVSYACEIARLDPSCVGILYYSFRRGGKTAWGTCDGYADTTENEESVMTIQSKTEDDGKIVFKKVADSWERMPKYFRPLDTGYSSVKKKISFKERNKMTADGEIVEYKESLNSEIYFVPSTEAAQDGSRVTYQFVDEVGKCKAPLDVNERHNINRECLVQGTDVLGFAYVTSTIEDMEKYASKEAETLWDRSDPKDRLNSGFTKSGLYRLFLPAYCGLQGANGQGERFVDEWGYTNMPLAKKFILENYNSLEGKDLLSYRRKYPINIHDSFALAGSSNNYSKERLLAQRKYNEDQEVKPWVKGNFVWKNGMKDTTVEWQPDKDGRWVMGWMPREEDRNKWEWRGDQRFPTREFAKSGADPFAHSHVAGKGSDAAMATIVNGYYADRSVDHGVVCYYKHRTEYTEESYEDMIKQMVFYSSLTLPENNVYSLIDYIRQRGYEGFISKNVLEKDPKKFAKPKRGISFTGKENREAMMALTQAFIYDHIGEQEDGSYGFCPDDMLTDWLGFLPEKWTKFDLSVAVGAAIILTYAKSPFFEEVDKTEFSDWWDVM